MQLLFNLCFVALAFLMLVLAKWTLQLMTPFKINDQLTARDNPAFGLSLMGYYLGVLIVYTGAMYGYASQEHSLWEQLLHDGAWALMGIGLLNVARLVLDKVCLPTFSTRKEVVEDRNCGMGAVEMGTYLGSALVVAAAISGQGGGLITALAFFGLGQLVLVLYGVAYKFLLSYDFTHELEQDNVAAGTAFAGNLIAVGILMMRGAGGDFTSWKDNLTTFGWYAGLGFVLLLLSRFIIDHLLVPDRSLHEEIVEDRNLNAAFLEGGVLIGLAGVIAFAI